MKCEREHTAIPAQTHGSFSTIPHGSFSTIGLFQGLDRVVKVFCHRSCNFRRRHNRHVLARVSACTATNGRRILRFVRSKNLPREPIGSMICHRAHAGDAGALLWTTVPSSRCANGSFSLRACSRAKDRVPQAGYPPLTVPAVLQVSLPGGCSGRCHVVVNVGCQYGPGGRRAIKPAVGGC